MRVIALLTARNEELVLRPVLEHLISQGVEVVLIDNESTDGTAKIAREYLGRGVLRVDTLPYAGHFSLTAVLQYEEQLAGELSGSWFIHHDADEIRLAPPGYGTLVEGFKAVEQKGYNAVNFLEFVFVPTQQAPNHERTDFVQTMRHYYHYAPRPLHRLNAWKRTDKPFTLRGEGSAHKVQFADLRVSPEPFWLKHYICLSREHAVRKYCQRRFSPEELKHGWHRKRARLRPEDIYLPDQVELMEVKGETEMLDSSRPFNDHLLFQGRKAGS